MACKGLAENRPASESNCLMTNPVSRVTDELKPCPFCGGEGVPGTTLDDAGYVMCASETCWCMTGYLPTEAEAIVAWNTRAISPNSEGEAPEYDRDAPPDHSADNAAHFILHELAGVLKVPFRPAEGSETWEGDVLGTMWHALTDGGVIDEWDGKLRVQPQRHQPEQVDVSDAERDVLAERRRQVEAESCSRWSPDPRRDRTPRPRRPTE